MGQQKSKSKNGVPKQRAGKNNPRNVGSTMSLDETGLTNTKPSEAHVKNSYDDSTDRRQVANAGHKPPRAPPKPAKPKSQIVKAMYDYEARYDEDLGFKKGERMEVVKKGNDAGWLFVRNVETKREGYVPSEYVVSDDKTIEAQEWWFGSDRREANKQLMLPGNTVGTFLIRYRKDTNKYALSVLDKNETGDLVIRHYLIRNMDSGRVYVTSTKTFADLFELIDYYKAEREGQKQQLRLTNPCPKQALAVPFKQLEVKRKDIVTGEKLGAGNFGEVYAGRFRNVVDVAVKSLKPGSMSSAEFLAEAETMHRLRHPRLVQLMGVCTEGRPLLIVTERMTHGALIDVLRKDSGGQTVKFPVMMDMAAQISDGMSYLEKQNFIHRDLRAANILVAENFIVKVADFGLARILDGINEGSDDIYTANQNTKFPIKWTAPEAANEFRFSIKSDVWSFGILLYELVTYGRIPYPEFDNSTTLSQVSRGYRMKNPEAEGIVCPPQLYEVMLSCWDSQADRRPTFEYLKNTFEDYSVSTESSYVEEV